MGVSSRRPDDEPTDRPGTSLDLGRYSDKPFMGLNVRWIPRRTLRRNKALKLALPPSPGRPYSAEEKPRMLEEAQKLRTPQMRAALALDLNTGLRDKELRQIRWEQIDLVHKKALTVGQSKSEAGTGRVIPLNATAMAALEAHAAWYIRRFGECKAEWFVFAFGSPLPNDPTRPITSFKTAWKKVREKAAVKGRWHDNRQTLVTELAESGAGDEVIMSIAGHVSRAMLSRYSHVRMEAKRRALEEIAARQRAADEKRREEAARQQQPPDRRSNGCRSAVAVVSARLAREFPKNISAVQVPTGGSELGGNKYAMATMRSRGSRRLARLSSTTGRGPSEN